MRYFRPKSLTWWSGIASITIGATAMLCDVCEISELQSLAAMLMGGTDGSPAMLIMMGLIAIGLYDKKARDHDQMVSGNAP